jgi:uncharacterized protein (TIGR02099 family)
MRAKITFVRRLLRRVLIVVLVFVATLNAAAFLLTPLLDRYRDELAGLASQYLGRPIQIGNLQARWRGFGPELALRHLRVGAPDQPGLIELTDVALDFGIWDMVRYLDLTPLRITLRDLEVHLVRDPQGRLHLVGFEGLAKQSGATTRLPLGGRLRLQDVTILWEDQRLQLPVRRLENAQLRLHLWPDRVSMAASVQLPGIRAGQLQAGAELTLSGPEWSGEVYLAGKLPEAAAQLGPYLPEPMRLPSGGIEFEAWTEWDTSRLSEMEGKLAVHDLRLDRGPDTPALVLDALSTEFRYQREGEDREIDLAGFTLRRAGHAWPASDLHLSLNLAHPGLPAVQLSADYLRLADLLALSRPANLPADLLAGRDGLDPDAELHDLRFRLEPGEGPARWQVSARFEGLRNTAWQSYPGVAGLDGRLQGDQQLLSVRLDSGSGEVDWPTLFRRPLPLQQLSGELRYERLANGDQQLSSPALTLITPDISTATRLQLVWPSSGSPQLDLQSDFRNGDGRNASLYYPVGVMSPELVAWLDRAIQSGQVPSGSLLLRGPLADFPFDQARNGRFEVRFQVRDLALDYLADWPTLQIDDAEVLFHNNSLGIELRSGRIYNSQILPTRARIGSLDPTGPLEIDGEVVGPLADTLRLLTESPLKARFDGLAEGLSGQGESHLKLDFALALDELGEDRLQGALRLQQASLALPEWGLELSEAKGQIDFDLDGVKAEDIQARMLGRPVRIDVAAEGAGHRLTAATRLNAADLRQRLPALPVDLLTGEADLDVSLLIGHQAGRGQPQALTLQSDLRGMAVQLPAPLGKEAGSARPLTLRVPLQDGAAPLQLSYGDQLQALFRPDGDRAAIHLGGGQARLPDEPVLRISGSLPRLELDPWLSLAGKGTDDGVTLPPVQADLQLGTLTVERLEVDDIRVTLQQQQQAWRGEAEAPTFTGRFELPDKASGLPLELDLDRLELTPAAPSAQQQGNAAGHPRDWPAFDLQVRQLKLNGHDFGKLTVKARHADHLLRLQPLLLEGPLVSFDGLAQWRASAGLTESDLVGTLHSPALGDLLAALGYSRQFDGASTDADISLSWPGSPGDFSPSILHGKLSLTVGQGRLLEVDPGVGRALGLLNFTALQRRLRLDFSDVFQKGMAFDKISGNFRLVDGNAYTRDLAIKGPSGDILITGRTGLKDRDLYQEVSVTPRFDATLPVAAGLAGGPITGLAVLVAQQVMKKEVDEFNRIRYEVTGSWDDPRVERLDDGGALSKILKPVTGLFDGDADTPTAEPALPPE